MSIRGEHITAALKAAGAGWGLVMPADSIAAAFNDAIMKYGEGQFDHNDKVASLLSESMMESAFFRTTEEYSKSGPYKPYFGRTFIQITWKYNYLAFGKWAKSKGLISSADYFVKHPTALAELKWAALGPVWYFTQVLFHGKPLTYYGRNIGQVGKAVNLGDPLSNKRPNGWEAREAAFKAVQAIGADLISGTPNTTQVEEENIMASGKEVRFWNNVNQGLKVGEQYVVINEGTSDVSVVVGENAGVQVVGVVEVKNPGGYSVHGFWRVVDWVKDGETSAYSNGIAIPAVGDGVQVIQAAFNGNLLKPSKPGRSMRLRYVVRVEATDATAKDAPLPTVNNVHIDGWKL
jgi:hypothetical protein